MRPALLTNSIVEPCLTCDLGYVKKRPEKGVAGFKRRYSAKSSRIDDYAQ